MIWRRLGSGRETATGQPPHVNSFDKVPAIADTPVILLAAWAGASILKFNSTAIAYMALAAGGFASMLILLLIVDYTQQLIQSERIRTGLVWCTFAVTAIAYAVNRGFFPLAAPTETVSVIFYLRQPSQASG